MIQTYIIKNGKMEINDPTNQHQSAREISAKRKSSIEPLSPLSHAIAETKNRYGSAQDFMLTFNKNIQPKAALHPERSYLGTAPSMNMVRQSYSYEVLIIWIIAQLEDINDFVGIREKMSISQMEYVAHIIATEYGYLKVSELHLFLHRLKAGHYGIFYGYIDPIKITQSLIKFSEQRRYEIATIERKRQQVNLNKQREEWSKTAITHQQYKHLKNKQL